MSSPPQATLLSPTNMASPPQARELRSALSQLSYLIRRITNIESEHYRTAQGPQTSSHLDMLEQMTRAVERTVQELSVACQKVEALADRWRDAFRQLSIREATVQDLSRSSDGRNSSDPALCNLVTIILDRENELQDLRQAHDEARLQVSSLKVMVQSAETESDMRWEQAQEMDRKLLRQEQRMERKLREQRETMEKKAEQQRERLEGEIRALQDKLADDTATEQYRWFLGLLDKNIRLARENERAVKENKRMTTQLSATQARLFRYEEAQKARLAREEDDDQLRIPRRRSHGPGFFRRVSAGWTSRSRKHDES